MIKWATLGEENTKFFHANATIRHNKNSIMSLKDRDGIDKFTHEEKAEIIWEAFKDRLSSSEFTEMHFNLNELLQPVADLDDLHNPFSHDEIDNIVMNLPSGKSPGPGEFNTDFMKKCWKIIAPDLYDLCAGFYDENICIQSINDSYVVLIPKVYNPSHVNDYRPISLLNSSIKLLTKVLANRLSVVILRLVHQNQHGFIKNRSIHDCLA
jgi:hypothetical protein